MKRFFAWPAALLLLASCAADSGFQKNEQEYGDIEYRLVEVFSDSAKAKPGDVLFLDMDYFTESGKKLYSSQEVSPNFRMYAGQGGKGTIDMALMMMHKGDSAEFRIKAGPFFRDSKKKPLPKGIDPGDILVFHVRLRDVFDGAEYQKQIDEYAERMQAQEILILRDYVRSENITGKSLESGIYKITSKPGAGPMPGERSTVTVHFAGSLIDGSEFDNSYTRGQPFTFPLGEGKSIKGFEEGISLMRQGEKCRLIIPSKLGYGARGVPGRIPPFSTLIFDVELISIN